MRVILAIAFGYLYGIFMVFGGAHPPFLCWLVDPILTSWLVDPIFLVNFGCNSPTLASTIGDLADTFCSRTGLNRKAIGREGRKT